MSDLISRQAAIDALKQQAEIMSEWSNRYAEQRKGVLTAVNIVRDVPSAQPEHGQWIKMSDADGIYYVCSECGEELTRIEKFDPQFDLFPRLKSIDKTPFCPRCGAKMDEEE